jgi:hypothetical protein
MTFEEEVRIAEYEQINKHLRNLYSNALRLAQLSMVVNPALGVAFAYVWVYLYDRPPIAGRSPLTILVFLLGFISCLGLFYNVGALAMYLGTTRIFRALLRRLAETEDSANRASSLHTVLRLALPRRYWEERKGPERLKFLISADVWTSAFFILLIVGWTAVAVLSYLNHQYKIF